MGDPYVYGRAHHLGVWPNQLGQLSPCIPLGSLIPALIGRGESGNVTSVGWQVTFCDPLYGTRVPVAVRPDANCVGPYQRGHIRDIACRSRVITGHAEHGGSIANVVRCPSVTSLSVAKISISCRWIFYVCVCVSVRACVLTHLYTCILHHLRACEYHPCAHTHKPPSYLSVYVIIG